jgi:hypothetical protein
MPQKPKNLPQKARSPRRQMAKASIKENRDLELENKTSIDV